MAATTIQLPASSAARKGRLLYVDALRGLACLWVILHHTYEWYPLQAGIGHAPFNFLIHLAKLGWLGVSLFLELSGFCLFYPIVKRQLAKQQSLAEYSFNIKAFFIKRARRILPPYYAAIVYTVLITILFQHMMHLRPAPLLRVFSGYTDLLLHLTMLYNLNPHTFGTVSQVFWSLALEWDLYLIFPLLVFLVARYSLRAILLPTFVIAVVWQTWAYTHLGFSWQWTPKIASFYHALPGRAFEFACGMTAAYYVAKPRQGQYKLAAILLAVMLVLGLWYAVGVSRFGPLLDQIWGVVFACLLVLCSQIKDEALSRSRLGALIVWIGTISYSLYLVHRPLITLTLPIMLHLPNTQAVGFLMGFLRMPLLLGVAYLFHLAFERPFMSKPGVKIKTEAQAEFAAAANPAP